MNDFPSRINYDENSELDQYSQDFMIKGEQEYKDIDNIANEVFNHPSQVNNGFNGNYHNKDHDIEVSNSSNEFQSNYQPEFGPNDYQNDSHDNPNQENIDIQNISFNIPGAFKNNDMEIDESPAFTIESDLYFDTQSQNTVNRESLSEINRRDLFSQNGYVNRQQFLDARQPSNTSISGLTGNNLGNGNNNHHILSTPTPSSAIQFDTPNSNSHQFMTFDNQHDNNSIYSSFLNDNEISSFHDQHIRTQSIDGSNYNPTSLAVNPNNPNGLNIGVYQNYNDLSPLTTTTSLSASINSLHSNQPSFFSAHQYLPRHSIEITNSNRNSIDQNSINSHNQNSSKRNVSGRYLNFNSISNYIPFMNDKEKSRNNNGDDNQRHSPSSNGPPSPLSQAPTSLFSNSNSQPTPRQQSKHLIRSIFKSNPMTNDSNNLNNNQHSEGIINGNVNFNIDPPLGPGLNNDEETTDYTSSEFLMMSPTKEEMEDSLDPLPTKKAKRTKRSLFNRFKGPKQDDINTSTNSGGSGNLSELEQIENSSKNSGNNSFHEDETDHHSFHGNMSRTPSSANTVGTHNNNNNNTITSNGNFTNNNLDPTNSDNSGNTSNGPDYAALFENVGKRKPKKVSKPSTTLSFTKSKSKLNKENEETENSSFNNEVQSNNSLDNGSLSISTSNTSHSHNPNNYYGQSSGPIQQQQELKTKQELIIDENEIINQDDEQLLDQDEDEDNSTLVNASKRILGSKLMKRKANKKEADIKNVKTKISGGQGVEVEVDLKTLDLPETTQVYPTNIVNAKSSVRGRKENKEADLTDLTKIYLCNYCSRRFKRQEHLKRHFRSLHTFEKPYDCEICHKKFSRSDNLNQHLKVHKQEEEMKLQNMS